MKVHKDRPAGAEGGCWPTRSRRPIGASRCGSYCLLWPAGARPSICASPSLRSMAAPMPPPRTFRREGPAVHELADLKRRQRPSLRGLRRRAGVPASRRGASRTSVDDAEQLESPAPGRGEGGMDKRLLLRADLGFAREELMAWCEANGVHFLFGLAKTRPALPRARSPGDWD